MGPSVQVLECYDDEVKARYEGEIIRFMTHLYGRNSSIHSHEMALIQLDDGSFITVPIENIRLIK